MTNYLHSAPLRKTVDELRTGRVSLEEHIADACERIAQIDVHVEALLDEADRHARLRSEAAQLSARYPTPATRPPLYGALVGVKDIFHVDGFVTQAGSSVPPESFAGAEALCVHQLRRAGALVAGKTVTTEFAYFEPGPTRNPHNLTHTPGGSSSGSAAAVAAGLCTLALGTQTIGSVIRPAAFCGIVGFKPTYNRIATQGLVYFSRTVDHVGLFTQDVAGMELAASVLCAGWRADAVRSSAPILGVPDGPYLAQMEPSALAAFEEHLAQLGRAGVSIKRIPALHDIEALNHLHRRLAFGEFAREHAALYPRYAEYYRPRTVEILEMGTGMTDEELQRLRRSCGNVRAELGRQMDDAGIDLWVCPPAPGPAPAGIHATGDPNMNLPWTHTGMPALTMPTGQMIEGLPLGLQLVSRYGEDEALLGWAAFIQSQT